jgi:hypothetical protein
MNRWSPNRSVTRRRIGTVACVVLWMAPGCGGPTVSAPTGYGSATAASPRHSVGLAGSRGRRDSDFRSSTYVVSTSFSALDGEQDARAAVEPPKLPPVVLSEAHAATCRVKVGDTFPDVILRDTSGKEHSLHVDCGEQHTLVVFWTPRQAAAREQFQRLVAEVVTPWSGKGLRVIAVATGEDTAAAERLAQPVADRVTCRFDPDGKAFAQIATAKLPRTYLLDSEHRVLWFDMEYSRGMRFDLEYALAACLGRSDGSTSH